MVRKWVIVLIIITILTAGCIFEGAYVNKTFDGFYHKLEIAKGMLEKDDGAIDNDENISYLKDLENEWDKKIRSLKALIWHTGLKEIEIGISRVITYTEENNYTEAMTELNAILDYLDTYTDDFRLKMENIL